MATKKTKKTTKKTETPRRGRTTRQGTRRRTTRRRPKWLPDEEPAPASPSAETPVVEAPVVETVETPVVEAPVVETVETPVVETPPAPIRPFAANEWVSVRYQGDGWFVHPRAGVFVPGTTTRLRGDLARELTGDGFQIRRAA